MHTELIVVRSDEETKKRKSRKGGESSSDSSSGEEEDEEETKENQVSAAISINLHEILIIYTLPLCIINSTCKTRIFLCDVLLATSVFLNSCK